LAVHGRTTLSKKTLRDAVEGMEAEFPDVDALAFPPRFITAPSDTSESSDTGGPSWNHSGRPGYRGNAPPLINVRGESVGAGGFHEAFVSRRTPPAARAESDGRHAPLAVVAAATQAAFLVETHQEQVPSAI
jgi:hypothetical protein